MNLKFVFVAVAGVSVGLAGACTTASDEARMAANQEASEKICRRMPVMGSNMPQRVCSTAEEWAAFEESTRSSAESFDNDRRSGLTQGQFENR